MKSQLQALTCFSASTWGLPLIQARMVYGTVVQPAMTYRALAWHQPQGQGSPTGGPVAALAPYQNKCLQVITGAYHAAPATTLEAEAYLLPLNLHLNSLVARAAQHLEDSGMAAKIESSCKEVRRYLRTHGQNWRQSFTEFIHPKPLPRGWQPGPSVAGCPGSYRPSGRTNGSLSQQGGASFTLGHLRGGTCGSTRPLLRSTVPS